MDRDSLGNLSQAGVHHHSHQPKIKKLNFDVLAITGDHSTPSKMKGHSWHPVPVIIKSNNSFNGISKRFTEKECLKGNMGIFEGKYLLNLIFLLPKH